jgi:F0F1-type ATP synthase membrane subunit c/vacuolar-type H+-ATPase subunit K
MALHAFALIGLAALGHALALGLTVGAYRKLAAQADKARAES